MGNKVFHISRGLIIQKRLFVVQLPTQEAAYPKVGKKWLGKTVEQTYREKAGRGTGTKKGVT